MKKSIVLVTLALVLTPWQASPRDSDRHVVLPNPKLLRCNSADCFQLWPEGMATASAILPRQTRIDTDQNCLYGMTAIYDRSIPVEAVKAAIDESYGKWAYADAGNSPVQLWRVTPQKFAIQLSEADKKDEKSHFAEAGSKVVIFIAFGGRSACTAS